MDEVTERFLAVFEDIVSRRKAKSVNQIAADIGIKPAQISQAKSGDRGIPKKYAAVLQSIYGVNENHILYGDPDVYIVKRDVKSNSIDLGEIKYPIEQEETPFVDLGEGWLLMITQLVNERSRAGYLAGFSDPEWLDELPKHTITVRKEHRGLYRSFEVVGDSMTDGTEYSIVDGSIVTGRFLMHHLWSSKLNFKRHPYWTIVHKTLGILTKEIINHDVKTGIITCHSLNPDKDEYPDFELHMDDIRELYNVIHIGKNIGY